MLLLLSRFSHVQLPTRAGGQCWTGVSSIHIQQNGDPSGKKDMAPIPSLPGDLCWGTPAFSWFSFISQPWYPCRWNGNDDWASWGLKGTYV